MPRLDQTPNLNHFRNTTPSIEMTLPLRYRSVNFVIHCNLQNLKFNLQNDIWCCRANAHFTKLSLTLELKF